jgi:hypothetical protein
MENKIKINACDSNGILYGIGKLLHSSILTESGFIQKLAGIFCSRKTFQKHLLPPTFTISIWRLLKSDPIHWRTGILGYNTITVWFDMLGLKALTTRLLGHARPFDNILKAGKSRNENHAHHACQRRVQLVAELRLLSRQIKLRDITGLNLPVETGVS